MIMAGLTTFGIIHSTEIALTYDSEGHHKGGPAGTVSLRQPQP